MKRANNTVSTKTVSKIVPKRAAPKDELLEELLKAFDDIKHGRISEWKPPFK